VDQSELHLSALWLTLQSVTGSGVEVSCAKNGEAIQRIIFIIIILIMIMIITIISSIISVIICLTIVISISIHNISASSSSS